MNTEKPEESVETSAVYWLINRMTDLGIEVPADKAEDLLKIMFEAESKFKSQIINAWDDVGADFVTSGEQYYDRIFNPHKLNCECDHAGFSRTVDSDFNPLCSKCGKLI